MEFRFTVLRLGSRNLGVEISKNFRVGSSVRGPMLIVEVVRCGQC